jgi:putative ABC transport system permease protein
VQNRQQFLDAQGAQVDVLLRVIYALLGVAILIAGMGIANTLSLSIHERTRELGLLRAIGQSRRQLRAMVRWESVIVATFGAVGGVGLGIFLGWGMIRALAASEGFGTFALPVVPLAVIVLLGAGLGVLAAVRPARRAARLDVLAAIATD